MNYGNFRPFSFPDSLISLSQSNTDIYIRKLEPKLTFFKSSVLRVQSKINKTCVNIFYCSHLFRSGTSFSPVKASSAKCLLGPWITVWPSLWPTVFDALQKLYSWGEKKETFQVSWQIFKAALPKLTRLGSCFCKMMNSFTISSYEENPKPWTTFW